MTLLTSLSHYIYACLKKRRKKENKQIQENISITVTYFYLTMRACIYT